MSKCIDADEILRYLNRLSNSGLGKQKTIEYITKYISDMPIAFDVDKVVVQLEELKEWEDVDGKAYYTMSEKQVINKAIKIVKRGGINDN